jgi:hypothetical protein
MMYPRGQNELLSHSAAKLKSEIRAKKALVTPGFPPVSLSMRRLRPVLFVLAFLLLVFLTGLGRYVYIRGFTSKWREYVTREFRKRGFEISLQRLTLDPFRGLVAKEVQVYDARDRRRIVAFIDQMTLQVNYANLARGKMFLDALDLRSAKLSLPLDPERPHGPTLKITKLNARLFFPQPESVYLASADARIFDVQVFAAGRLINPQAFRTQTDGRTGIPPEWIERALEEIESLQFDFEPPVVDIKFSGDLAQPEKISFDVALWGERIRRDHHVIKSLYASLSCRDGIIDLRQLTATDAFGELIATGAWQPEAHTAQLQAHSTIDVPGLVRAFRAPMAPLDDLIFYTQPTLDFRVEWSFSDPPSAQIIGHLASEKFAYKSVVFERGTADFSWNNDRWSARDIHLAHRTGNVTGDVMQTPGSFRARLRSTINPKDLQPLLTGATAEMLAPFAFPKSPELSLDARGTEPTLESIVVDGSAALGAATFRGVVSDSANATVHYENRLLSVSPFRLHPAEGRVGDLLFDFQTGSVRLN